MMGNGFMGQMDPRTMLMQMQMARQGAAGGTPIGMPGQPGMQSMGMRSPNAAMPAPPPVQQQPQQQNPMQMAMLMEALKKRQQPVPGANAAQVNATNAAAATADPMTQGAAQAADAQRGNGLLGLLQGLPIVGNWF